MLCQSLCEALPSNAVVSASVENPKHSPVYLQHRHTQGCPTQFIHQDMAVNHSAYHRQCLTSEAQFPQVSKH